MYCRSFNLLGTRFYLTSENERYVSFVDAFVGSYTSELGFSGHSDKGKKEIWVTVRAALMPAVSVTSTKVQVHRSQSYPKWDFSAHVDTSHPNQVIWENRGIAVDLDLGNSRVTVRADVDFPDVEVGESIFHMCRGIAVFNRNGSSGNFLHASAVAINGRAVLFLGRRSAGKTTCFLESIINCGAIPLTNDRSFVTADDQPVVHSWPSYTTLCEGTILNYPALKYAAMACEQRPYEYKTQSWPGALRFRFDQEAKRLYPMHWLKQALGVGYQASAQLGAIVISEIRPELADGAVRRMRWDDPADKRELIEVLSEQNFDQADDGFMPWHQLPFPSEIPSKEDLMKRLKGAGVTVFQMSTNPESLRKCLDSVFSTAIAYA